jgi:hypothetical protein
MYEEYLFEETVGEQPKKAVVMVGRMNPPTAGHYKVIDLMKKFARLNKGVIPIVVVVAGKETSKDKQKNPLSAEDRIKFMSASGKANGVKFLIASSAFAAFEEVRKDGYEPFGIAAGSDRGAKYKEMLDKYFTTTDGKPLKHEVISGLEEREDPEDEGKPSEEVLLMAEAGEDIPVHLISGSMAREAVKLGLKKAFAKITDLDQKLANMMFKKIEAALAEQEPEKT